MSWREWLNDRDDGGFTEEVTPFVGREHFTSDEAYNYWRMVTRSLERMFALWFLEGFEDVDDYVEREEVPHLTVGDLRGASEELLGRLLSDPGWCYRLAADVLQQSWDDTGDGSPESFVPPPISEDQWDELPDTLTLGHVAGIIGTTPKNVRNLLNRGRLPKPLPKSPGRINQQAKWDKTTFLDWMRKSKE